MDELELDEEALDDELDDEDPLPPPHAVNRTRALHTNARRTIVRLRTRDSLSIVIRIMLNTGEYSGFILGRITSPRARFGDSFLNLERNCSPYVTGSSTLNQVEHYSVRVNFAALTLSAPFLWQD